MVSFVTIQNEGSLTVSFFHPWWLESYLLAYDYALKIRGLFGKFADTANKTRIVYHKLMKFYINKYQLSGTMLTQYDWMVLNIDIVIKQTRGMVHGAHRNLTFIL